MRALVTGGEQGLGAAITEVLEKYVMARVDNLPGDVIRSGKASIDAWLKEYGHEPYDYVVNNFGINHLSHIGATPEADADILTCNVLGPYWVINALVRRNNGPARVVNVASQTYRVAQRTTALYCASKAALVQMTRVMARELAPDGWVINAIAPGKIVDTDMARRTDDQVLALRGWTPERAEQYALSMIPMGRFTNTKEVAMAIGAMLVDLPPYINGTVIDMTGGV